MNTFFPAKTTWLIACLFYCFTLSGQHYYKTPSGKKYHRENCRMVETVSSAVDADKIARLGLAPCKICKPPITVRQGLIPTSGTNKAVGVGAQVRCSGKTKENVRCKRETRSGNGYCFQHVEQYNGYAKPQQSSSSTTSRSSSSSTYVGVCGAKTASDSPCKRKVKGGGRCYQH